MVAVFSSAHVLESISVPIYGDSARHLRILVTGASGFVGRRLTENLVARRAHQVRCAIRTPPQSLPAAVDRIKIRDISSATNWVSELGTVDLVLLLAARVPV